MYAAASAAAEATRPANAYRSTKTGFDQATLRKPNDPVNPSSPVGGQTELDYGALSCFAARR